MFNEPNEISAVLVMLAAAATVVAIVKLQHLYQAWKWRRIRRLFKMDPVAGHQQRIREMGRRRQWGGK